jgi:hypothetical protein
MHAPVATDAELLGALAQLTRMFSERLGVAPEGRVEARRSPFSVWIMTRRATSR